MFASVLYKEKNNILVLKNDFELYKVKVISDDFSCNDDVEFDIENGNVINLRKAYFAPDILSLNDYNIIISESNNYPFIDFYNYKSLLRIHCFGATNLLITLKKDNTKYFNDLMKKLNINLISLAKNIQIHNLKINNICQETYQHHINFSLAYNLKQVFNENEYNEAVLNFENYINNIQKNIDLFKIKMNHNISIQELLYFGSSLNILINRFIYRKEFKNELNIN